VMSAGAPRSATRSERRLATVKWGDERPIPMGCVDFGQLLAFHHSKLCATHPNIFRKVFD
jgi:hypothetical protein